MLCPKCGHQLDGAVAFCPNCAAPVTTPPVAPQKSKKNKIVIIILSVIVAVLAAAFVYFLVGYLNQVSNGASAENVTLIDTGNVALKKSPEITNPSDSLDDMLFVINGEEYQFPLKLEDFTENSWETMNEDDKDRIIPAGEYTYARLYCGEKEMVLAFYNPTEKDAPIEDCYVGRIEPIWVDVILPGNITTHKSTRLEVKEALGMPNSDSTHTYWHYGEETEDNMFINYALNNESPYITLKFDEECYENGAKDDDVLKYVDIQWFDPDVESKQNEGGAE